MLKYLDDNIKRDYIRWVNFIYDGNYNDSIFSNEELFKIFVEEKINEDVKRYFTDSNYKIIVEKSSKSIYSCWLYLNDKHKQFDVNNSFYYDLDTKGDFDYMYYRSHAAIDLPF